MPIDPRGSIVRIMRRTERETTDGGAELTRTISAPGIIVRLAHIHGRKPSDVRRDFVRYCHAIGILAAPCEYGAGQFSTRTGKSIPGTELAPTAYQCLGAPDALAKLVEYFAVSEWHFAVGVRVPVVAGGSGPEKVRPPVSSAFGKPATVRATTSALARQRDAAIASARKSWKQESQ
ncbi:hypothetical protein VT84_33635 [Gemmata sp. SH-PL17]|uniref:hypothetical protein n=1 Tax=Gemmata sp. SH-PL17 TaxID=1630693 RepID=UPI00078B7D8B|nr:hypothetical protein [Gemmata sp. SH-PL17]AMV29385.1 hypothetical protein VT84_33635 [Gemmata sp. SH-PL17]